MAAHSVLQYHIQPHPVQRLSPGAAQSALPHKCGTTAECAAILKKLLKQYLWKKGLNSFKTHSSREINSKEKIVSTRASVISQSQSTRGLLTSKLTLTARNQTGLQISLRRLKCTLVLERAELGASHGTGGGGCRSINRSVTSASPLTIRRSGRAHIPHCPR
jgi:hypothetical protein